MYRHQGVTLQPLALRAAIKQVNREVARVAANQRKPPHNLDEENLTRASGGPQGHQGTTYVTSVRLGCMQAAFGSHSSGVRPVVVGPAASCRLPTVSLHDHLETG